MRRWIDRIAENIRVLIHGGAYMDQIVDQVSTVILARDAEKARADAAEITVQKLRAGLPLSYVKTNCKHDGSWTTYDGKTCMACAREAAEARASALEKQLSEERACHDCDEARALMDRKIEALERELASDGCCCQECGCSYRETEEENMTQVFVWTVGNVLGLVLTALFLGAVVIVLILDWWMRCR
jgi:hypothetical protein